MRPQNIVLLSFFQVGVVALPFTEWLQGVVVNFTDIPEINLHLPGLTATVDILSGTCHSISLGNLTVEQATGSAESFATNFTLDGLGLQCHLECTAKIPLVGKSKLDVDFSIVPSSQADRGFVFAGIEMPTAQDETAPLPEGVDLTQCHAPLVLNLKATSVCVKHDPTGCNRFASATAATTINGLASAMTPPVLSGTVCGLVRNIVEGVVSETISNVSSALMDSGVLTEAGDIPEPVLSTSASNINEMLQTGDLGRALQAVLHHGRYDVRNTSQLWKLADGFVKVLNPTKVPQLITTLWNKNWSEPLSFAFDSSIGNLTAELALDRCGGKLPLTDLLKGTTTDHAQQVQSGDLAGHCEADLQFSLNPRTLRPETLGISLDSSSFSVEVGKLDVSTNLAAAIAEANVYLSLLLGINGNIMINDYSADQWTRPGCLINILDGKDASNLRLLGLHGALGAATLNLNALDQDPTLGSVLQSVSQWANALLEAYQPVIALLLKGRVTSSAVSFLNEKVMNFLTSNTECIASGYTSPVNQPLATTSGVWTAVFGGVALIAAALLLVRCSMRSVRKVEGGQQNLLTESDQQAEETGEVAAAGADSSEVLHAKAPLCLLVERSAGSVFTWLFVLACPVLLVAGLGINSYTLGQPGSLQGGLKWMLGYNVNDSFSVLTALTGYPWPTQATGILPLQVGFFFVVAILAWFLIIAPVLLSICSVVLWAVPLSPRGQKRLMRMSEIMYNWQALDLYAACIIGMCLLNPVLSRVLDAIVSNASALDGTCTGLNGGFGIQCITVHIKLLPGMGCLVAGIVSLTVAKFLVGCQAKKVIPASPTAQAREGAVSATGSRTAQWTMNFILLAITGLLVLSLTLPNANLQTTVMDTDPEGGGATTQTAGNLLQFTIWSLALDLGRYGLPEISVLIILGSVVMPLVQIVMMLACWNLPASVLSVQRRGQILAFLSLTLRSAWLGTFLLAILGKAMHIPFVHADDGGGSTQFIVEVCPEVGFYTYAVATFAAMCTHEVIMMADRRAAESGGKKVAAMASGSGIGGGPGGAETGDADAVC